MDNRFNLIDEQWIPIADHGHVSLGDLFRNGGYPAIGGNPVQKIALLKLLLAIAQAAATPQDETGWRAMGSSRLAEQCLAYLEKWRDRFYLFGDRPFLQMPDVSKAKVQEYGAVLPEVSTGNTTILTQTQIQPPLSDTEKGLLIVTLMGFALGGKKTDNSLILTQGYVSKTKAGKPGPSVAHMGLLHSFIVAESILDTLWINLFSQSYIERTNIFPAGVGVAPWEEMPQGEDCKTARRLKKSLMGRLVPLSRFCLLTDVGLHYTEGIAHDGYNEGMADPSVAINNGGKKAKALWVNPDKRPWRELTSLLSFIEQAGSAGFDCRQTQIGVERVRDVADKFALWSGGLRVSSNAGEQFVSGSDDFVSSTVWLTSDMLGEIWFAQLKIEMDALDTVSKHLYGAVMAYFKAFKKEGKGVAGQASQLFWQLAERNFQQLIENCDEDENSAYQRLHLRRCFASCAQRAYNRFCPNDTARQLDAWAECRPNHAKYLKREN